MQPGTNISSIVDHLFRREYGRLVAMLTHTFGTHNLQLAEDVVQETLLRAMETWKIKGLPANPGAWLFTAAKNKALDLLRHQQVVKRHAVSQDGTEPVAHPPLMDAATIPDDQLRMMFACCHPAIAAENQVALILKTLCGFSVNEVARAFITGADTIEKRLYRARRKLQEEKVVFEIPAGAALAGRLDNVLAAIYLLFNEGYQSASSEIVIRKDILEEALRLAQLLHCNPLTRQPRVSALLALMHFTNARNEARLDDEGAILLLKDQDRSKWNREMIAEGIRCLEQSATGGQLSQYHLEAAIAYEHCTAPSFGQTNWPVILHYFNLRYQLDPSPIVAINRAVAEAEVHGAAHALSTLNQVLHHNELDRYYLYHAVMGELHYRQQQPVAARECWQKALELTHSPGEKEILRRKINAAAD